MVGRFEMMTANSEQIVNGHRESVGLVPLI